MKFTLPFLKNLPRKKIADQKQEALQKLGREQFKVLLKKGLSIPVVLL
ncbi:MAG TPA: hypothetical protein VLF68_02190 [Candidatus Saccharimonadales bacterium]|nr:hypothetical protein [Candidatus Saccharimonadales bacterium]